MTHQAAPMEPPMGRFLPLKMEGLTPDMVRQAEEEIGETPEVRQEALKELRRLIEKEKDFNPLKDEIFLLRFLRLRKMNTEKAFKSLRNYYIFKAKYSRIITDFKPSEMKKLMDMNCVDILPYRDEAGSPIGLLRIEYFDPNAASIEDLLSIMLMGAEQVMWMDSSQVCGGILIFDMKGLGFKVVQKAAHPATMFRVVQGVQLYLASRIKAFHVVNEPFIFHAIFKIASIFLSEKLRNRFQFHGSNLKSFHEQIPPEILPEELGGTRGPMDCRAAATMLMDLDDHYARINKYGFQDKRAQQFKRKSSMAIFL